MSLPRLPAVLAPLALAALLAGCGGSTTTVTVSSAPHAGTTGTQSGTASTGTSSPQASTGTTSTGAAPTTSTRTATAPAFTETSSGSGSGSGSSSSGLSGAVAVLRGQGYTPNDTSQYHPNQTLQVLVGTRTGSADGYQQRAFFFLDGHYIGTDTSQPSAGIKVISQSDTEATLAYPLYRAGDPLCCPGGGQATVRFVLNNGRLTAAGSIPPVESASSTARR